ncbi:MAG: helix-turn-helix domain-containing protein [Flavobacteriales bacterium]|nr:helix-turn-helix domain-containing protein [Flavobacteriales bacterium]
MTETEKNQIYVQLGYRIRDAREKAGLTQALLGEILGLSRVSIVNIEKGKQRPPLDTLYRVAVATNARLIDLLPIASITLDEEPQYNEMSTFENQLADFNGTIKDNIKQFILDTRNTTTSHVSSFNRIKSIKNS